MPKPLDTQGEGDTYIDSPETATPSPTPFELRKDAERTIVGAAGTEAEFDAGDLIAGQFTVERVLGRGGMGIVYQVKDRITQQHLALKTVLPSTFTSVQGVKRFIQEVNTARRLRHPYIVAVYDAGQHDDAVLYYTMEYLEGSTLREILEARGQLRLYDAVRIAYSVCLALEHAHRFTVHRDISPENIMVVKDQSIRLMDFGIAKALSGNTLTAQESTMGKAYYMAPEQRKDAARVDGRADLYSLGVMFFEMLTGEMPVGTSQVTALRKDLPKQCDEICARALAPIDQRYANAREMRRALQDCYDVYARAKRGEGEHDADAPLSAPSTSRKHVAGPESVSASDAAAPARAVPVRQEPARSAPDAATHKKLSHGEMHDPAVIWKGHSRFVYYVPGILWGSAWFVFWRYVQVQFETFLQKAVEWEVTAPFLAEMPFETLAYGRYVAGALAVFCVWRVVRRILHFITGHYEIREDSVRVRQGVLSSEWKHLPLSKVKTLRVRQSLWGRLWSYAVIEMTTNNYETYRLKGIPNGVQVTERLRSAMPRHMLLH